MYSSRAFHSRARKNNLTKFYIFKRESNAPANQSSLPPSTAPLISTPETVTEETASPNSSDSLVRHSEFYKGSTNVTKRPSSESALSFIGRERGGSTLSDLVQQGNVDNDVSCFQCCFLSVSSEVQKR